MIRKWRHRRHGVSRAENGAGIGIRLEAVECQTQAYRMGIEDITED